MQGNGDIPKLVISGVPDASSLSDFGTKGGEEGEEEEEEEKRAHEMPVSNAGVGAPLGQEEVKAQEGMKDKVSFTPLQPGAMREDDEVDRCPAAFPGDDEGKGGTLVLEFFADKPYTYITMTRAEMSAHITHTLEMGQALRHHHHPRGPKHASQPNQPLADHKELVLHSRDLRKVEGRCNRGAQFLIKGLEFA